MTFEYDGTVFNLLDTPGHEDFSEDTYRTLTAVDSAVMVIDAAKGIEARTRKLFEVCRLRDIPIITFINKMDRESRDPFDLLDEIEKTLALDTTPMTWPIGRGRDFIGTLEVATGAVRLMEDDPQFNARRGAVLNRDGDAELDAAIMDGAGPRAGAVAGLRHVKNPIELARLVMEKSPHVLLVAEGAEDFALEQGVALVPRDYFRTEAREHELE